MRSELAAQAVRHHNATPLLPQFRHIVVVVEENHGRSQIIGNRSAPYINALSRGGATFTQAYGVAHPSEPNYLALFSGSTHGMTSDACPKEFGGPNLAAQLLRSGRTFVGYSEGLPHVGYLGCSVGSYARRHAPWTDFPALPARINQPLSDWPTSPRRLPTVAFVAPDLIHDMHDGTVAQADNWLHAHFAAYARWAQKHDSLLVVTWDENDDRPRNRIAMLVYGAHVRPAAYPEAVDHYRLLRTVEAVYQLSPIGAAHHRAPISDIWRP